jgi:hypothetical protein
MTLLCTFVKPVAILPYADVKTTEIFIYILKQGADGVIGPLSLPYSFL